jgi:pimeloyl-ACP methyl ester carboxylesterase
LKTINLPSGLTIAYLEEGTGSQTLLLIHGMGSNRLAWGKLAAGLKGRMRCIALDLPNYGGSTPGDFPSTMSWFASVVWEFAEQLGLNSFVLGGHSMGGQIALIMALQRPFVVEKLLLFAPAGFEVFTRPEEMVLRNAYAPELLLALSDEQIRQNFRANFFQFPADAAFMIDDRLQMKQSDQYAWYCRMIPKCIAGMLDEPVFQFLPQIARPSLVFFGRQDQLIPNRLVHPLLTAEQVARKAVPRLQNARLELLDRCGHFPQWERGEEVIKEVVGFLGAF